MHGLAISYGDLVGRQHEIVTARAHNSKPNTGVQETTQEDKKATLYTFCTSYSILHFNTFYAASGSRDLWLVKLTRSCPQCGALFCTLGYFCSQGISALRA